MSRHGPATRYVHMYLRVQRHGRRHVFASKCKRSQYRDQLMILCTYLRIFSVHQAPTSRRRQIWHYLQPQTPAVVHGIYQVPTVVCMYPAVPSPTQSSTPQSPKSYIPSSSSLHFLLFASSTSHALPFTFSRLRSGPNQSFRSKQPDSTSNHLHILRKERAISRNMSGDSTKRIAKVPNIPYTPPSILSPSYPRIQE